MAKRLIHHSPLGALEVPTVLGAVEPGQPFTVADDIADNLLQQSDLYSAAPAARTKGATQ